MRLSQKEAKSILYGFNTVLKDIDFKLYLFGSRSDDTKKGGDIDLLVLVSSSVDKEKIVNLKSKIRNEIFNFIPEQKIDITVATTEEMNVDTFLISIRDKLTQIGARY